MKLLKLYKIAIGLIILFAACGKSGNVKSLEKREQVVEAKEHQLLMLEQQLKLKEQDLLKREQAVDSLRTGSDSIEAYNPELSGNWVVTMQCIETSCEGSAIGDTKTEQWNISYHNNRVVVKAYANKKIIRTYTGLFRDNSLVLAASTETGADMNVTLMPHQTTDGLMEGQRVIRQGGKCRIVYAIKAEKL